MTLVYTVANAGTADATNVELSTELPSGLTLVDATASNAGETAIEEGNAGATLVIVTWPVLAAGDSTATTVRVQVPADVPNGMVIDNLGAVTADNAASATAGISIGMPPALLPEFW